MTLSTPKKPPKVKSIVYCIPGSPIPLARVRFGKERAYDGQKHTKLATGIYLANQHDGRPFYSGALHVDVVFYMPLPIKARFKNGSPHCCKPDLSNLIKFIEDIGTGILYVDDALISSMCAEKRYDNNPRTEFTIKEIDGKSNEEK